MRGEAVISAFFLKERLLFPPFCVSVFVCPFNQGGPYKLKKKGYAC